MRRFGVAIGVVCALWAALPAAQEPPASGGQVFRGGVDVIRIDASVLDKNRQPIRGLKASDFTIKENGQTQRIVAVAEVDAATADPTPNAWMRYAPREVVNNNLADQVGDGQAVAIVLDDFTIPEISTEMAVSTRDIGRYIVDSLGPSDVAAVVFPFKPGRTEDFTSDRARLLAAVDKFESEQPRYLLLQPETRAPMSGDMIRYSPALARDPCFQIQPVIPTLRAVTAKLAGVPQRRKALYFVSVGLNFEVRSGRSKCQNMLYDELLRTFEMAQRFNVNIHSVDPAGAAGFRRFLEQPRVDIRNVQMAGGMSAGAATQNARVRHDFLEILSEETGGRPIVETDDLESALAEVFQEYSSYYLIGYETTFGRPDGKYRDLKVTVNGRDAEVHTRKGRWAPNGTRAVADEGLHTRECLFDCFYVPPRNTDYQLAGLSPYQPLPLRVVAYPIGRTQGGKEVEIAAVLTVRLPRVLRSADDQLTVIRTAYDEDERAGRPVKDVYDQHVEPTSSDELRYDVLSHFSLPPGRHQVRFNGTSKLADASGSVFVEVVVPELGRASTASSLVLGTAASGTRTDALATLLPIVPTTARDFSQSDRVTALLRLFAPEGAAPAPVDVAVRLIRSDSSDAADIAPSSVPASAFDVNGTADYKLDLPMSALKSGLHLLSVTATFADARQVRRDVVFRIR